jgi:hypothetical protein
MKPWFSLTLVSWVLLCLLLSLSQQAARIADSGQWLDRGREVAYGWPTAAVLRSMEFDPIRAGPLASLVIDTAWAADDIGPPSQETHGPPEQIGIGQVAVQSPSSKQHRANLLYKITGSTDRIFKTRGFATAFS